MFKPRKTPGLPIDKDNAHFKAKSKMNTLFNGRSSASRALIGGIVSVILLVLLITREGWSLSKFSSSTTANVKPISGDTAAADDGASCTRSYDGKKPVTQYVVMVDAGSSGSRVHVYEFNNCKAMPRLVKEDFKMIDGGLSSYDTDAEAAANSLNVLLDFAKEHVPVKLQGCTPIAVKATAGLRKLGEEKSAKILTAVKTHLEKDYPFPVVENGVVIMPGEEEGVYAWVTANYLLGKIGTAAKDPTVAVFDLGGGSTQIVFEPTFADPAQKMSEGEHKYKLSFGGRDFVLYQHSYLGYGLNEARSRINSLIAVNQVGSESIVNPCLPPGTTYTDKVPISDASKSSTVKKEITFVGPKEPSPLQCRSFAEKILEKDAVCANPPCAFNGVYQPALLNAFPNDSDMYVFSYFYDRTHPLGMPQSFSIDDLKDLTNKVCEGPDAYSSFEAIPEAVKTLKANPQWCLDLSYMLSLLHTGYDIHSSREVRIAKKIANNELGWCLGASLPLLDGTNWKCQEVR